MTQCGSREGIELLQKYEIMSVYLAMKLWLMDIFIKSNFLRKLTNIEFRKGYKVMNNILLADVDSFHKSIQLYPNRK